MTTTTVLSDMDELVRLERGATEVVFGGNYGLVRAFQQRIQSEARPIQYV